MDDDGGFDEYTPTTTEPGPFLLISTVVICILLNVLLPCVVGAGRYYDKKREKLETGSPSPDWIHQQLKQQQQGGGGGDEEKSAHNHIIKIPASLGLSQGLIVSGGGASIVSHDQRSVLSTGTSFADRTAAHGKRSRTQRRFQIALEKRAIQDEAGIRTDSFFRFDKGNPTMVRQKGDGNDDQSLMSKLDTDEVSVESVTMNAMSFEFLPKAFLGGEMKMTCSGPNAWWKPNWIFFYLDRIVSLSEWDYEMRKVVRLTLPFAAQAFFTGMLDVMTVSVIGKNMGTKEVSAYVVVSMLMSLTNEFVGGFWNALTTLCSQAVGANKNKLCGEYVQMAILLYTLFSIPFMFLWWEKTEDVILWFGFDEEVAEIGREYARVFIFAQLVGGVSETLHSLLDVIELENYSTVMGVSEDILDFVLVLNAAVFAAPQLYHIGMIHLGVGVLFLTINIFVIWQKDWFGPYMPGLVGSFSLFNFKAVWLMCKTAFTLSIGFLLMDGEWELLTIFASFLGPAEVAAWSIIGSLWGAIESLTEAIGDAAEVRCGFLLGRGKPKHAQISSYKSVLIAVIVSFLVTSVVFIMGEDIATWLTHDPTLQRMIADLLPLFGIGNITMTIGTVSWTLLGAQGRYKLATVVAFCGSWLVTIPLAAVASGVLKLNLQGQTAAVVLGYMVSGTVNAYFLFRSDWEELSQYIIDCHDDDDSSSSSSESDDEIFQPVTSKRISGVQQTLKTP